MQSESPHPENAQGADAAARFESNRRYDYRPALENVERPPLVLTTRPQHANQSRLSLKLVGLLALIPLALGAGTFLGLQLGRSGDSPKVAEPEPVVVPTQAATVEPPAAPEPVSTTVAPTPTSVVPPKIRTAPSLGSSADAELLRSLQGLDLDQLTFVPGEINLTSDGQAALARLAELLLAQPRLPVELRVRTYSESTPGQNHGLSVQQANALTTMLSAAGVDDDRIAVVGLGAVDADRPTAAAALFFDLSRSVRPQDPVLSAPLVFDESFTGSFGRRAREVVLSAGAAIGDSPVTLVGYSWGAGTERSDHDRSHQLLDAAKALLVESGLAPEQIATVGMGRTTAPLAEQTTVVTVEAGAPAQVAVSLAAVPADGVSFLPGTASLTASGTKSLDAVGELLISHPEVQVEIAVHFYGAATSQGNHDASRRQAETVAAYFRSIGISEERLNLVAHGDPPHFAIPGRPSVVTFTVIR